MVRVKVLPHKKVLESIKNGKIIDVLHDVGLKPDAVVVLKDGKPIPVDDKINKHEEITVLRVTSLG